MYNTMPTKPFSLITVLVLLQAGVAWPNSESPKLYPIVHNDKVGYIDHTGKTVIEPQLESLWTAWHFCDGRAGVRVGEKWGFIDTKGKLAVPARFDAFKYFSEGFAAVRVGDRWTFVDQSGATKPDKWFEDAHSFSEGLAAVKLGGKWGFVDTAMQMVIPPRFDGAWGFTEGLAPVKVGRKWGFTDKTGRIVVEPQYYWVDNFSEGLAYVQGGKGNEGYVDKTGKLVIGRRFWDAHPFSSGLAAVIVEPGGTFGLIDKTGKMVIDPQFEEVCLFSEGLAAVRVEYEWGYIDTSGKFVIGTQYDRAESFSGGLAQVRHGGDLEYIDKTNKNVWWRTDPRSDRDTPEPRPRPWEPDPVLKSHIAGPQTVPAKTVSLVGNPRRKRYPDASPFVFSRNIWEMILYQGRIYLGGGDYWANTGPVEIYSFAPGENEFTLEYTAPEEMVSTMYVFDDRLVVPGNDPQESWDLGNLYIKETGKWRKLRTIPNGVLCFEMAYLEGSLLARVSTQHAPTVLKSSDWGKTWTPIVYSCHPNSPDTLFTFQGKVHAFDGRRQLCTLENGAFFSENMIPKYRTLVPEAPRDFVFYQQHYFTGARPFGDKVVLSTFSGASTKPEDGPRPLYCFSPGEPRASIIKAFAKMTVMDTYVAADTFYVLCSQAKDGKYENNIYSTKNLVAWRCMATFETDSFARSFVTVNGEFYVSIGCPKHSADPLPTSTGDILRVIPR